MATLKEVITVQGFIQFVREQGVIGLAVGFILGGSVSKVVSSLVNDIINPFLGIFLGKVGDLASASVTVQGSVIKWGSFVGVLIDFIVIAAVVYFIVKGMGLDKLDKSK